MRVPLNARAWDPAAASPDCSAVRGPDRTARWPGTRTPGPPLSQVRRRARSRPRGAASESASPRRSCRTGTASSHQRRRRRPRNPCCPRGPSHPAGTGCRGASRGPPGCGRHGRACGPTPRMRPDAPAMVRSARTSILSLIHSLEVTVVASGEQAGSGPIRPHVNQPVEPARLANGIPQIGRKSPGPGSCRRHRPGPPERRPGGTGRAPRRSGPIWKQFLAAQPDGCPFTYARHASAGLADGQTTFQPLSRVPGMYQACDAACGSGINLRWHPGRQAPAGVISVWPKSFPLNRRASPAVLARAYAKQFPKFRLAL